MSDIDHESQVHSLGAFTVCPDLYRGNRFVPHQLL